MVLNMAQTWHQLRPGEIRNDCGGCHAHSQKPTLFQDTAAAKADYVPFDLVTQTPLLTSKKNDQSGKKWDTKDETGLPDGVKIRVIGLLSSYTLSDVRMADDAKRAAMAAVQLAESVVLEFTHVMSAPVLSLIGVGAFGARLSTVWPFEHTALAATLPATSNVFTHT